MKRTPIQLLATLLLLLPLACCQHHADRPEPVSIAYLRSLYGGHPRTLTEPICIEGCVVSTDRHGEFYHRMVIQDATAGIEIAIDQADLHLYYAVGDSLRVECCGLTIGGYGGAARLGGAPAGGYEVSDLAWDEWLLASHHLGSCHQPPKADTVDIQEIGPQHIATLVGLVGTRFVEAGESWAEAEGVATTRHLVDVATGRDTLAVRTSGYTDFHHLPLPEGPLTVRGIVGYFGGSYQLTIASPDDIVPLGD